MKLQRLNHLTLSRYVRHSRAHSSQMCQFPIFNFKAIGHFSKIKKFMFLGTPSFSSQKSKCQFGRFTSYKTQRTVMFLRTENVSSQKNIIDSSQMAN